MLPPMDDTSDVEEDVVMAPREAWQSDRPLPEVNVRTHNPKTGAARSEEAAEVKEPGFAPAYARFVVKRTCCAFWLSLTVTLLLSAVGIMIAMEDAQAKGQSSILSKQTGYDWTVTGALLMKQKDMVDSALSGRDSLSDAASSASAHVAPTPRGATEGHVSGKETGASGNMARVGLIPATEKTRATGGGGLAGWRARTWTKNGC